MSLAAAGTGPAAPSHELEDDTIKEVEKDAYDGQRTPSDPSTTTEKGNVIRVSDREQDYDEDENIFLSHEEQFPIDPNAEEETHQFTFRAVFVGCCLGGVIAASK